MLQRARVFLLSHMRAYTSLLGHVLGSHPEIDGYYEMHRAYVLADDLDRQLAQYAAHDALQPGGRLLFDKLLHNDYTLNLALPALADATVLVALRPPAATLPSIVALFAQKDRDDPYATPEGATGYYLGRLAALAGFAARHPGRFRYFDADTLLADTPRIFAALERWLGLGTPLTTDYRLFAHTGIAGAGDSSPALASGRIQRASPPAPFDPVLLMRADAAYRDCRAQLIARAAESVLS